MVESLKKAEAHLERVTVEVNIEGAEIQIGDVDLGVSPLPFAWYLEPGTYEVRVSKPGFAAHTEPRVARAGIEGSLTMLTGSTSVTSTPTGPASRFVNTSCRWPSPCSTAAGTSSRSSARTAAG